MAALSLSAAALAQDNTSKKISNADVPPEIVANKDAMETMHHNMMISYTGIPDVDFARGMVPHHQGAIDMAKIELQYGKDPELRKLAKNIIDSQAKEIRMMQLWLATHDKNK